MNKGNSDFRLVLTTADSAELAGKLARALVERRLAACVNVIGPVSSGYRWKGEVTSDEERSLFCASWHFEARYLATFSTYSLSALV